jgi:DNA-binding response OmpR family regulator
MRILLVEDDLDLVWAIRSRMEQDGYAVEHEADGKAGLAKAVADKFDVIVLDIMLPGMDGLEICRQVRQGGIHTPILVLTARVQEDDRVRGLDCGADDYLAKPFSYPELFARVRALIRRAHNHSSGALSASKLVIDTNNKTVVYDGREVPLTSREYGILEYLAYNKNGTVTKQMIEEHVWGGDNNIYSNVIEVLVGRIRNKLNPEDKEAIIKTVRGLGYTIKDEKSKP